MSGKALASSVSSSARSRVISARPASLVCKRLTCETLYPVSAATSFSATPSTNLVKTVCCLCVNFLIFNVILSIRRSIHNHAGFQPVFRLEPAPCRVVQGLQANPETPIGISGVHTNNAKCLQPCITLHQFTCPSTREARTTCHRVAFPVPHRVQAIPG